mgnify:FL=1
MRFISRYARKTKVQPDQKLIFYGNWPTSDDRLIGARDFLKELAKIAGAAKEAA